MNCSGSDLSRPYSDRMVATMSSVALGPATRRAGSPGATLVMTKVSAAIPIIVPTSVSNLRKANVSIVFSGEFLKTAHGPHFVIRAMRVVLAYRGDVSQSMSDYSALTHIG